MKKTKNSVVVNVSFGSWYPNGQKRLEQSLGVTGYNGDTLFYLGEDNFRDCPKHEDHPYIFKTKAMLKAVKKGYDYIFWLDSSIQVIKPLDTVYEILDSDGYYFVASGQQSVGSWSSDKSIECFAIGREKALTMPELASSVLGFNMSSPKSLQFLVMWHLSAMAGLFDGSKTNYNSEVSSDSRVLGHRQDQTLATLIAHLLGMTTFQHTLRYKQFVSQIPPETIFLNDGGY